LKLEFFEIAHDGQLSISEQNGSAAGLDQIFDANVKILIPWSKKYFGAAKIVSKNILRMN